MSKHSILFIGLDTHKEFVEVAYIEDQRGAKPVHLGRQPCSKVAIKKLARQFESKSRRLPYTLSTRLAPAGTGFTVC